MHGRGLSTGRDGDARRISLPMAPDASSAQFDDARLGGLKDPEGALHPTPRLRTACPMTRGRGGPPVGAPDGLNAGVGWEVHDGLAVALEDLSSRILVHRSAGLVSPGM